MYTQVLILLGISIVLQFVILIHQFNKKPARKIGTFTIEDEQDAVSLVKLLNAYNKMIAVKWYVDMMMDGDFGALNIAQIQFMHQMKVDSEVALKDLQDITNFSVAALPDEVKHMAKAKKESDK